MKISILERIAEILIAIAEVLVRKLKERDDDKDVAQAADFDPDVISFG